ncbi:MAG: copper-translocating P-type ATPase [Clostridia bacterium]|nr:copper-translocating P-type ATPase [Clostridia bacterium]
MKNIILSIEGMTCSACSNGLEKYLNKQNGIISASVNLVMANATINYDEKILDVEKLEKFVKQAGFVSRGIYKEFKIEKKSKLEKYVFIIFTLLAIFIMYVSMGHMMNLPVPTIFNPHTNPQIYTITLFVGAVLFLIYGGDILKNGYKNLIHMIPNMDTLVTIGVLSSFLYSVYGMYKVSQGDDSYTMNLYFESAAIVIYFIKLGRYLDGISKDKTKEAIQKLVEITPNKAILEIDGQEKEVTLDEIKKGNILISKPGEKIAVDGVIIDGKAHLDESFITGESKPAEKTIDDKVVAGSLNYDGYIKYKAERIGRDSTVSEIVRLVIEASNTKAPIAKIADKISGWFVSAVIIIAIITLLGYLLLGAEFSVALEVFVTILVVACPCSLGLATPLAIVVSEGLCATNGILVKKSEILENTAKVDTIVFDKTGTLTFGKLKISKINKYTNKTEEEILAIIASLENMSTHPISQAFNEYVAEKNIEIHKTKDFENIAGHGVCGMIDNQKYYVGNRKLMEKYNIQNNNIEDEEKLAKEGNSIVYLADEKEVIAIIGVNDIVRDDAHKVIETLNEKNIQTIMLTGDNEPTAKKIASEIGITKVIANVLPSEKVESIKKLKEENRYVMMCGDGINDSPALATANIGVSMKSGTDIAMDSSDVILTRNDLNSILKLITISEKTIKNIKQNLFWAFLYNALMIPIAMGIFNKIGLRINPMIASFAMVISSLTVIFNTLRLKKIVK